MNGETEQVIGTRIDVPRRLGPGLLESAYEACLCREWSLRGVSFERQRAFPLEDKGMAVECG